MVLARWLLVPLVLGVSGSGSPARAQRAAEVPVTGRWEPPFQHDLAGFPSLLPRFNAVHMGLIPRGPHRGKVIVWDVFSDDSEPQWKQRWSIVDVRGPGPATFLNDQLALPAGEGDFFCAGFAWSAEGNLFLAGGTSKYPRLALHPSGPGVYLGGRLAYVWDPADGPMGSWIRQDDLEVDRWYPTVLKIADGSLVVAGGTADTRLDFFSDNDFERFVPSGPTDGSWQPNGASQLFPGPGGLGPLLTYPRLFHLSTGGEFLAGMTGFSVRTNIAVAPGVWSGGDHARWDLRVYGTAVLLPLRPDAGGNYRDQVMVLGGNAVDVRHARDPEDGDYLLRPIGTQASVETCFPGSSVPAERAWVAAPPMHHARTTANGVLLADGSLLVVGGRRGAGQPEVEVNVPELFDGTRWTEMPPQASVRSYHSTAVLLPDGRVLSAGGDTATWDYQVFVPSYLRTGAPRPLVSAAPASMGYGTGPTNEHAIAFEPLPAGHAVARAVLIAPGAVTHHTDVNQRWIELVTLATEADRIVVRGPRDAHLVPPGIYMLFLLSAAGVPSEAVWVTVG